MRIGSSDCGADVLVLDALSLPAIASHDRAALVIACASRVRLFARRAQKQRARKRLIVRLYVVKKIVRLRAMGRCLPISMKAVMCQLLWSVLWLGACLQYDDGLDASQSASTAGKSAGSSSCQQPDVDCDRRCSTNTDCDTELGRVCRFFGTREPGLVQQDAPTRTSAEPDPDTDAGPAHQPLTGYCTSRCDTNDCPAGMVCSSSGACTDGCDRSRLDRCTQDEFCNFEQRKCFPRAGSCKTESDCPKFTKALMSRGTLSCISERCRFEPTFGMSSALKLAGPTVNSSLPPIIVQQPSIGQRITNMETFTFQFSVPASVMVVSILLENDYKDLTDAADVALWTAYLDRPKARAGIRITDGGAVRNGEWFAETPLLPLDRPLYFLALGYDEGLLTAQSEAIPFMIGKPLPQPGDACPSVREGAFCSEGSALFCIEGKCRTPCFSDEDCFSDDTLRCLPLGVYEVSARVCG